jgi:hypothetical protein
LDGQPDSPDNEVVFAGWRIISQRLQMGWNAKPSWPEFRSVFRKLDQNEILGAIYPCKLLVDTSAASEFDRCS